MAKKKSAPRKTATRKPKSDNAALQRPKITKEQFLSILAEAPKPDGKFDQGIKYSVVIDPAILNELDAYCPENWRDHPRRQRQALNAFIDEVDWTAAIGFNRVTRQLYDGHMRLQEAIKMNRKTILLDIGDWTPDRHRLILQNQDPLGAMAKTNKEALASLTSSVSKTIGTLTNQSRNKLEQLTNDLKDHAEFGPSAPFLQQSKKRPKSSSAPKDVHGEEDADESAESSEDTGTVATEEGFIPTSLPEVRKEFLEDMVFFEGATELGIPLLRPDMIADASLAPRMTYDKTPETYGPNSYYTLGSTPWPDPEDRPGCVLGMFTEDWRFERAYLTAGIFVEDEIEPEDWAAICVPDFSLYQDHPAVLRLYNLYRSRWCARYWQECGYPIIPIVQSVGVYHDTPDEPLTKRYAVETLPEGGCPVLACQARKVRAHGSDFSGLILAITQFANWCEPEAIVIYGGRENQKYLHGHLPDRPKNRKKGPKIEYIFLPSFIASRKKKKILK